MVKYFLRLFYDLRKCRNWQTSKTKDLVIAISCGFKSHLPQEILKALSFQGFFLLPRNKLSSLKRIYNINETAAMENQRQGMYRCGYSVGMKRVFHGRCLYLYIMTGIFAH